jgi:hypothetical protein
VDFDDEELGSFDAPPNAIDGFRVTPSADVPALERESWASRPESFGRARLAEPVCAREGAFGDSAAAIPPYITAIRKAMIRII